MLGKLRPDDEQVRVRAHQLWEAEGRPLGRNEEFWHQALANLAAQNETAGRVPPAAPRSEQHLAH